MQHHSLKKHRRVREFRGKIRKRAGNVLLIIIFSFFLSYVMLSSFGTEWKSLKISILLVVPLVFSVGYFVWSLQFNRLCMDGDIIEFGNINLNINDVIDLKFTEKGLFVLTKRAEIVEFYLFYFSKKDRENISNLFITIIIERLVVMSEKQYRQIVN